MSGICGIVNFDGAPVDPELLRKMAEASAYRGPDGIRYWINGNVGFAHLALNTTRESLRERQPLSNREGSYWIVADARIDNRGELIHDLEAKGVCLDRPTDAELILAAYDVWGTESPEHLIGDFAFALWDNVPGSLVCARDHLGIRQLFYAECGRTILWASQPDQLIASGLISEELDRRFAANFLVGQLHKCIDRTVYAAIKRLPPGTYLHRSASSSFTASYWHFAPRVRISNRSDQEYESQFRELLLRVLRGKIRNVASVAVLVSGGLDSSSIICFAGELLEREPALAQGLLGVNAAFSRFTECDEGTYVKDITRQCRVPIHRVASDEFGPLSDHQRGRAISLDEPSRFHLDALWAELLREARDHSRTVLTGQGGDHLLVGSPYYYSDLARTRRLVTLANEGRGYRRLVGHLPPSFFRQVALGFVPQPMIGVIQRIGRHRRRIPSHISKDLSNLVEYAPDHVTRHPTGNGRFWALWDVWQYFSAKQHYLLSWFDFIASRFAIEFRHPFLDVRLIEFALSIPPDQHRRNGIPRYVLRQAVAGTVPHSIISRRQGTQFMTFSNQSLRGAGSGIIVRMLQSPRLEKLHLASGAKLRDLCNRFLMGDDRVRNLLWYAISLELWLRSHSSVF